MVITTEGLLEVVTEPETWEEAEVSFLAVVSHQLGFRQAQTTFVIWQSIWDGDP